jgi:Domain of unknown function (DUF5655)
MSWVCPTCHRKFARTRQSHECAPAMTLDEYFSTGPERERPIFDAVLGYLETLGPIHVEPVSVGIFLKSTGSFVELRPKTKWVAMSFPLPYRLDDSRIARKMKGSGPKTYHVVNLREAADLDDQVKEWLAESYDYVTG